MNTNGKEITITKALLQNAGMFIHTSIIYFKQEKNMAILVTGGAGFIGSNLIKRLNDQEITDIIIVENIDDVDKMKNLSLLKFSGLVDYREMDKVGRMIKSNHIEQIIHLGAICDTMERDVVKIMHINYYFSRDLISTSICNKIPIVVASSAATYGQMKNCDDNIDLSKLKPTSPYALSKHLIDLYCNGLNFEKVVCLKFFNVYGDNEWVKPTRNHSFIYKSIMQAITQNEIRLFKGIEASRDFVHVDDVCNAIFKAFDLIEEKKYGVYNVGTGVATDLRHIAEFIAEEITDLKLWKKPVTIDELKTVIDLTNYQFYTKACISKSKSVGITCDRVLKAEIRKIINSMTKK